MKNKQEKGAIMVEVLAVLALIGVMGPMLYNQVVARNQEISNVNMAAEMRAVKEAMSAVIAADGAFLGDACTEAGSDPTLCGAATDDFRASVESFLPVGMEGMIAEGWYDVKLFGYKATVSSGDERTFVFGVASSSDVPATWNFKRAARVASLIGADGGIREPDSDNLIGTNGTWQLNDIGGVFDEDVVVATTALDTFDPDLGITDPYAVAVPYSMGFERLHAWNYFSVGAAASGQQGNCIDLKSRKLEEDGSSSTITAQRDIIKNVGKDGCDPLFWVGSKGDANDKSVAGQVYVKNNLYIGRDNAENKHAVAIETQESGITGETANKQRRIAVYNIDGKETLTIDAMGRIIAKQYDGDSEKFAETADGEKVRYGVDPANTSVLNDVRLTSRGGARLSDILPTYINKGMSNITSSDSDHPVEAKIKKPGCPRGYAAAIVVTPMKWGQSQVEKIIIPEQTIYVPDSDHELKAPAGGGDVSGEIYGRVPSQTVTGSEKVITSRNHLAIEFEGTEYGDEKEDDGKLNDKYYKVPETADIWTVKIGYKENPDMSDWETVSLKDGEIQALAQTYCVYTGSADVAEDRLLED